MVEPWVAPLEAGDPETAWDLFIERYRRLIFAAIRRYATDHDEVMDCFARVCEALREDDFARLRRCAARYEPDRPFSTLLVVVTRNLIIDWFRHRTGRRRLSAFAAALPARRRRIFEYVFLQARSHVEAFELLRTRDGEALSFGEFLKELRETYAAAAARHGTTLATDLAPPPTGADHPDDPALAAEQQMILGAAMESLAPDERLAVQMYVVDGLPALQVARALGYPNAKAVYNRVYRALAAIRAALERAGIMKGDL